MKKVLVLTNSLDKHASLAESLSDDDVVASVHLCDDLCFCLDGEATTATCFSTNENIREFAKIIILSTPEHFKNHALSALACYCRKYGIPLYDDVFTNTSGKLYALSRFWENGIPFAKTFFGPTDYLARILANGNAENWILKTTHGAKGRDNYLIHSEQELLNIINNNSDIQFILQEYIPNKGDWRIIVINYEPKLAIYRSSSNGDHRNNTSVGGAAKLVPLEEVDSQIIGLAIAASKALDIKIAGADIMQDSQSGNYTVLEVNRTPQLATGAFIDEKTEIIQNLIRS